MKREIVVLGLLIVAVCVISLIPFRRTEGFDENRATSGAPEGVGGGKFSGATTLGVTLENMDGNTVVSGTTVSNQTPDDAPITSNEDFMLTVNRALVSPANEATDKDAIHNIQTRIVGLSSQNAKTLVSEMSNTNNLSKPRTFLQYMKWFGEKCPITSDTCSGAK